jgi:hypothetical protein
MPPAKGSKEAPGEDQDQILLAAPVSERVALALKVNQL